MFDHSQAWVKFDLLFTARYRVILCILMSPNVIVFNLRFIYLLGCAESNTEFRRLNCNRQRDRDIYLDLWTMELKSGFQKY